MGRIIHSFTSASVALLTVAAGCTTDTSKPEIGSTEDLLDPFAEPATEVADKADTVIVGQVNSLTAYRTAGAKTDIHSLASVEVQHSERGSLRQGDEVLVVTRGGTIGETEIAYSHAARFVAGERTRLFLEPADPEHPVYTDSDPQLRGGREVFVVVGGDQGKQAASHATASHNNCTSHSDTEGAGYCYSHSKRWSPDEPIKFWINPNGGQIPAWAAVWSIKSGIEVWNQEASSWAYFEYQGLTNETEPSNGKNVFYFGDCGGRGLSRIVSSSTNIYEFDTCFNKDLSWTGPGLKHTTIHESGHGLGLSHINDTNAIMHPSANDDVFLSAGERNFVHDWYDKPEYVAKGDLNGDGADDLVTFVNEANASVWVALDTGGAYGPGEPWHNYFAPKGEKPMTGDFDGDGKDDIVTFVRQGSGDVWVCLSSGSGFTDCGRWHTDFGFESEDPQVGDVDCDGKDDILVFTKEFTGDVWVALSDGSSFGSAQKWHDFFGIGNEVVGVSDFDRDGCDDIVTMLNGSGFNDESSVLVARSTGSSFEAGSVWLDSFCGPGGTPIADHGNIYCVKHDGSGFTSASVNSEGTAFNAEQDLPGSGGPLFNQSPLLLADFFIFLTWFEHGNDADVWQRSFGAPQKVHDFFAPGPCPWPGDGC